MPTSVINLVAGFVIRPYITKLSEQWERNALPEFAGTIGRLAAIIAALTVLAVGVPGFSEFRFSQYYIRKLRTCCGNAVWRWCLSF